MKHPIQSAMDLLSAQWAAERGRSQMTLGKLIAALEGLPGDAAVADLGRDHSYRGYYTDLAFEPEVAETTASELAARLRRCVGAVYEGYKGGDFTMGLGTPLWVAEWGQGFADRIMGLALEGDLVRFVLQPEDDL